MKSSCTYHVCHHETPNNEKVTKPDFRYQEDSMDNITFCDSYSLRSMDDYKDDASSISSSSRNTEEGYDDESFVSVESYSTRASDDGSLPLYYYYYDDDDDEYNDGESSSVSLSLTFDHQRSSLAAASLKRYRQIRTTPPQEDIAERILEKWYHLQIETSIQESKQMCQRIYKDALAELDYIYKSVQQQTSRATTPPTSPGGIPQIITNEHKPHTSYKTA